MSEIIKNYRDNDLLRRSFNELAAKTFGLDFEDWYQNGFWSDNYIPYSLVKDGRVVANVSVNRTNMMYAGVVRHFLQLGTVMTDEAYRNQGFIREIMKQINDDYLGKADGIYLFANDSVLDFYPKFGFQQSKEYQYSKEITNTGACQFEPLLMNSPARWKLLEDATETNIFHGRFDMTGNSGLILFYVTKFMQESVYYHRPTATYVIADRDEENLRIHNIFSASLTELDEVIKLFGSGIRHVTLGFVPLDAGEYRVTELREEDCTLFIRGSALDILEQERLRIPSLSHA